MKRSTIFYLFSFFFIIEKALSQKQEKKRGLVEKLLDFFLSGKNPEWSVQIHKTVLLKLGKGVITKARIKSGIVEKLLDFFLSGKNPKRSVQIHKTG